MDFIVWKVNLGINEEVPRYVVSIKGRSENPMILDSNRFYSLFPSVDVDAIPTAPNTGVLEIRADLKVRAELK